MPTSRTLFFTCRTLCYIFCFTLDNNVGCGSLSLLFLLYVCVLVILKSSYAQEMLHNSQDFTSPAHAGPSTWNASASTLPLQSSTLEVGHSSDIPSPWSLHSPPPIQRDLPLLWLPDFFVPVYLPFYSFTLCLGYSYLYVRLFFQLPFLWARGLCF